MRRAYRETITRADGIAASVSAAATAVADLEDVAAAAREDGNGVAVKSLDAAAERVRGAVAALVLAGLRELAAREPQTLVSLITHAVDVAGAKVPGDV